MLKYVHRVIMKKKRSIRKKDIIPKNMTQVKVNREITSDYVLEIYEKAKRARSEQKKKEYLAIAETLSKHVGKWLVE